MSIKIILSLSFVFLCAHLQTSFAGGPLSITNNNPVIFKNPNIVLHIETGKLGNRTNSAADKLVKQAFSLWNKVPTSNVTLTQGTDINQDLNANNFNAFLASNNNNFIAYDSDGTIIDLFFTPANNSTGLTVGFNSTFTIGNDIVQGYSVINGKFLNKLPDTVVVLTIAHELGHLFGLDHTQTNIDNTETSNSALIASTGQPTACQSIGKSPGDYPLMYPFICRTSQTLHPDDISAVSKLYPTTDMTQHFGTINGFFVDTNGKPILGANIWAEDSTGVAISTVSDYLKKGDGSYQLSLPAGNYTLHANSINPEFFEGSSIGPYATTKTGLSFQAPHPIAEVVYQGNGPGNAKVITVNNTTVTNIVFALNGTTGTVATSNIASSGGGGGSLSPLYTLFLTLSLLVIRRKF